MKPPGFPFPALVGLGPLKMALQLAAVDRRLSVLIRGDKGAGKSTAARALVDLLPRGSPFVNLPIGTTEDRLLGGLDVEKALKGEPTLKPGLLAAANGGVLYVDEVNLLPDHLADALLDAAATGVNVVEREGFSATESADFVMVGSMNPEEGALRPQLLDRFALAVDVAAPMEPWLRRTVVERRLSYDANPASFDELWRAERSRMARQLDDARIRLPGLTLSAARLDLIAERIASHQIRSLRADLAVVRASRALAAIEGVSSVAAAHVEAVLPLALAHRLSERLRNSPPEPKPPSRGGEPSGAARGSDDTPSEQVFAPLETRAPRLAIDRRSSREGVSTESPGVTRGVSIGVRQTQDPRELDVRATVLHAATRTGTLQVTQDDLHERIRTPLAGARYLFVVDSSGSHAVRERMRLVKGAVSSLLASTTARRDEVVIVVCRGGAASVLIEPTAAWDEVQRALDALPTGGRTPLAHALELAATYVTDGTVMVLVTDGHANVSSRSDDPWADALAAAGAIRCPSVVIDSEDDRLATGRPRELAAAMGGTCVRLADLDETSVLHVIRGVP